MTVKPLIKTKTFYVAVAALVTLLGAVMTGAMPWAEAIPAALIAIGGMTLRHKMPK